MSETPPEGNRVPVVDIRDVEDWKIPPEVTFDQAASLKIARWVLVIFGGVYALAFVMAFIMLCLQDATYDKSLELLKFLISSILPLVTLAVGYYLGDRRAAQGD